MRPEDQMQLPIAMPPSAGAMLGTTSKRSKNEVAYGPAYEPGHDCGHCVHFDGKQTCELVEGTIDPAMVSDLFEGAGP